MNAEAFFATEILVYAVAKDDARADVARALLAKGGAISVQVLNEFADVARRRLNWPWPDVAEALALFRILCSVPLPVGLTTHATALEIAQRDGLTFYDALLVASALEAGCSTLLSEDMQDG